MLVAWPKQWYAFFIGWDFQWESPCWNPVPWNFGLDTPHLFFHLELVSSYKVLSFLGYVDVFSYKNLLKSLGTSQTNNEIAVQMLVNRWQRPSYFGCKRNSRSVPAMPWRPVANWPVKRPTALETTFSLAPTLIFNTKVNRPWGMKKNNSNKWNQKET